MVAIAQEEKYIQLNDDFITPYSWEEFIDKIGKLIVLKDMHVRQHPYQNSNRISKLESYSLCEVIEVNGDWVKISLTNSRIEKQINPEDVVKGWIRWRNNSNHLLIECAYMEYLVQ